MRYNVIWSSQFKKDYKLAMKRHYNIDALDEIIVRLSCGDEKGFYAERILIT